MKKITLRKVKNAFSVFRRQYLENLSPTREKIEEGERRLNVVEDFITYIKEND